MYFHKVGIKRPSGERAAQPLGSSCTRILIIVTNLPNPVGLKDPQRNLSYENT
jgi:hypothetical protein